MKRYIIVIRSNGYCGCKSIEYYIFPEGTTDSEIDEYIEEGMYDYAESYVDWEKDWDEREKHYDNIAFDWFEANDEEREKHKEKWFAV